MRKVLYLHISLFKHLPNFFFSLVKPEENLFEKVANNSVRCENIILILCSNLSNADLISWQTLIPPVISSMQY